MSDSLVVLGFGPGGWGRTLPSAALVTRVLALCAYFVGLVIGVLGAWAKLTGPLWLYRAVTVYGVVLRGVPDLLVIYLFYFGGRQAVALVGHWLGLSWTIEVSGFLAGVLAIGLISGAGQMEVLRGAYAAVPPGTIEAARVTGMGSWLTFRRIIAPQALPVAIPGMANQWQSVVKETALVSVTGVVETLGAVNIAARSTSMPFTFFLAGAVVYLMITSLSGLLFRLAESSVHDGGK